MFAKLTLFGVAVAALPLAFVALRVVGINKDALAAVVRDHQAAVALDLAGVVERGLDRAGRDLLAIRQALVAPQSAERDDNDARRLAVATALLEASEALDHIAIYDVDGARIDVLRRADFADMDLLPLRIPVAAGASPQGRAGPAVATGVGLRLPIALEIYDAGGRLTGSLLTLAPLAELQRATERLFAATLGGASDSIFVVDKTGRVLVSAPDKPASMPSALKDPVLAGLGELASFGTRFVRYGEVRGASDAQLVGDDGGVHDVPLVATVASLPRYELGVCLKQSASVVYASIDAVQTTVVGAVGLALAMAVLLSLVMSRQLTRPILALAVFARKLGERRFSERISVRTRDEIETLATSLNDAAEHLATSEILLERERKLRSDLGRFLPAPVVDRVARGDGAIALGGTGAPITVLFADIVDFTRLAASLEPEQLVQLLNDHFSILTEIVFRNGGTVDKFMGDSIMAFWGAPDPVADHAERAVRAAAEMHRFLEIGNARWEQAYGRTIQLAIGVSTGNAVVGNIGSSSRLEYTAVGTTVNLAAALERVARPKQVLVSDATMRAVAKDAGLAFERLPPVDLPGHTRPVEVWSLVA